MPKPKITFTFKSETAPNLPVFFDQEAACDKFLSQAADIVKEEKRRGETLFIVRQSCDTKRKSRIMKQYQWFSPFSTPSKQQESMLPIG